MIINALETSQFLYKRKIQSLKRWFGPAIPHSSGGRLGAAYGTLGWKGNTGAPRHKACWRLVSEETPLSFLAPD